MHTQIGTSKLICNIAIEIGIDTEFYVHACLERKRGDACDHGLSLETTTTAVVTICLQKSSLAYEGSQSCPTFVVKSTLQQRVVTFVVTQNLPNIAGITSNSSALVLFQLICSLSRIVNAESSGL